jgi:hypothetical protein
MDFGLSKYKDVSVPKEGVHKDRFHMAATGCIRDNCDFVGGVVFF